MHDLLEGVAPLEIALVVRELIQFEVVARDCVNVRITDEKLGGIDASDTPNKLPESVCRDLKFKQNTETQQKTKTKGKDNNNNNKKKWNLLRLLRYQYMLDKKSPQRFYPERNCQDNVLTLISKWDFCIFANDHFRPPQPVQGGFPVHTIKPKHDHMFHHPHLVQHITVTS